MTQPSAAFIPADALRPAVNPLAAGAGVPVVNPLIEPQLYAPTAPVGPTPAALSPAQQSAVQAIRDKRLAEEELAARKAARQTQLEQRYGKWETAGLSFARGVIDAVLSPGAIYGLQSEALGSLTGVDWLRDFGRDLGESSNAQALWSTMAEAFDKPGPMATGTVALTPYERTRRALAETQEAWPLLSGVSRVAGMAVPAVLTGGVAGAGEGAAMGGSAAARIGGGAAIGAFEGAGGGAQAAYEDARPLRDVLTSALVGSALGGTTGAGFAGVSTLVSRLGSRGGAGVSSEAIEAFAEQRVGKALNARASELNKLPKRGHQMARDLLDHRLSDGAGVFPDSAAKAATMSLEDVAERVAQGKGELASGLNDLRRSAGSFIEESAPELRPNAVKLREELSGVLAEVDDPMFASQKPALQAVIDSLDQTRTTNKLIPLAERNAIAPEIAALRDQIDSVGVANVKIPRSGMRDESLKHVRGAFEGLSADEANAVALGARDVVRSGPTGASRLKPIEVTIFDDVGPVLQDGRHRLLAAREAGATEINAKIRKMNADGDYVGEYEGPISIGPRAKAPSAKRRLVETSADDTISLQDLMAFRKRLSDRVYDSKQLGSNVGDSKLRLQRMERMVDGLVDETVENAVSRMDDSMKGAHKQYQRLWQSFHHADQILQGSKGLQGALARSEGNAFFSLSSSLAGSAALAGDLAGGGGAFSAAKGLASAGIHKYAREHGSAFFAVLANNLAKRGVRVPALQAPALGRAALGEGDVFGHLIAPSIAGGREGQLVLTELERARQHVASAVDAAGPNPDQRELARSEARERLAHDLAARAGEYDAANWAAQAPTPLQKVVYRSQLLDRVSADAATAMQMAVGLFPARDFDIRPERLARLVRDADGPAAIASLQARVRGILDSAPPTYDGDGLRYVASEALSSLSTADVGEAMAIGHSLTRALSNISNTARDDITQSYAAREANGFADDLSSDAFGEAGRAYRRLSATPDNKTEQLTDPATLRDMLRVMDIRGRLPSAARELAGAITDAHRARAELTGEKPQRAIAGQLKALEQRMSQAEDAVTLDGGPLRRVLDYFEGKTANVDKGAPEDMVLNAVRPKVERLLPVLGKQEPERDGGKAAPIIPKGKPELLSLYRERLQFLTETAVDPEALALGSQLEGLPNVPPQLAAIVATDAQERMQTLLRDMPKPREDIRGKAYESLSSEQLRVANAMWEATTAPMTVFDDFQRGKVDYDKVKYAWKQYPGLKQAAQVGLFDAIHSHLSENERAAIPGGTLTQLDYLLGFDGALQGTVNREFSARITAMAEEMRAQQEQNAPSRAPLNMPAAAPTFTQRLSNTRRS